MMKFQINKKIKLVFWALIFLFFLYFLIVIIKPNFRNQSGKVIRDEISSGWNIYTNKKYEFEIKFPDHWNYFEDFSDSIPIINFYPKSHSKKPPFDNFSEVSHISIFPNGLPIGGVVGDQLDATESIENERILQESVRQVINFNLHDGSVWARMIQFSSTPKSWNDRGYVWIRYEITGYDEKCMRGEQEISAHDCDFFGGDRIQRFGRINKGNEHLIEQIISSYKFLK